MHYNQEGVKFMNVLFSLEPLYELNTPCVMDTWLQWFSRMHAQLEAITPDYEFESAISMGSPASSAA